MANNGLCRVLGRTLSSMEQAVLGMDLSGYPYCLYTLISRFSLSQR